MKEINFSISKGNIVLQAKDDTYLSARAALAVELSNKEGRYEMQADERDTHERKLLNSIESAVSSLKSELFRFNISSSLLNGDEISITYHLSKRFDDNKQTELEKLTGDYLYKYVLHDWWSVNFPDSSRIYMEGCKVALDNIKKCLSLLYSNSSSVKYSYIIEPPCYSISIFKEELKNAFHNELLKISRTMVGENSLPDFNLQTHECEGEELIERYVKQGFLRCSEILTVYLDSMSDVGGEINYSLRMPCAWKKIMLAQLCEECFCYILYSSLFDYLKTVMPNMSSVFAEMMEQSRKKVKHCVTVRDSRFTFKPLQPF